MTLPLTNNQLQLKTEVNPFIVKNCEAVKDVTVINATADSNNMDQK